MRFLLSAIGSYGDVHPFVGLGKTLVARGHAVSVIANPNFGELVRRAGLTHVPFGTLDEYERMISNPAVWRRFKGPVLLFREAVAGLVRRLYETVMGHYVPDETIVVAHGLDLGSRIAQEKHGIPLATVALAPLQLRSNITPPLMAGFVTRRWPFVWPKRLYHWVVDLLVVDRILDVPINGFRKELGLTRPVKRFYNGWCYSPQLVLGLFPAWFAPPQPDWPPQTVLSGFPLWDQSDQGELPEGVAAFLDDGKPPVVFAPGSAMCFGHQFFNAAVEACLLLRRRGVLLTKYPDQLPEHLPDGVRHLEYIPFSQVLPRAAAFVHHGGIGSTAQGLAAGVPQLIMPQSFDQPDNADRASRLGVAEVLPPKRFRSLTVATTLERLIGSRDVPLRCRDLASRCDGSAAFSTAADTLEQMQETG